MNIHLTTFAALLAALSFSSAAYAQEDSLERALAQYNSGLTAPMASAGVSVTGDARVRNVMASFDNIVDVDVRTRLNFDFNINDHAQAFIQFTGNSNWGSKLTLDPLTDTNSTFNGADNNNNGELSQVWVETVNALGDGGTARIGASYYTFGSGRLLGTDEWDGHPQGFEGVWYSNEHDGFALEGFYMSMVEGGVFGSDIDLIGLTVDYSYELSNSNELHISPYWLRQSGNMTPQSGNMTPVWSDASHDDWRGLGLNGLFLGFDCDFEMAWYEAYGADSAMAWAFDTAFDLEILEEVGLGSLVTIAFSDTEDGFEVITSSSTGRTINQRHNAAGLSDTMTGGLWGSGKASTMSLGFTFTPLDGYNGGISMHDITMGGVDYSEFDITLETTLGGGLKAMGGLSMVDRDGSSELDETIYAVLSMDF